MFLFASWMACSWAPPPAAAPPAAPRPHRVVREGAVRTVVTDTHARLETAVLEQRDARGNRLTLVAAVHVATPAYYAALTEAVSGADVVLYEGLTGEVPDVVATAAGGFEEALGRHGLTTQSAAVAHDARWAHADLSIAELDSALRAAGASEAWVHEALYDQGRSAVEAMLVDAGDDARRGALARLALLRSLGEETGTEGPESDWYWEVVIGLRDARVAERWVGRSEAHVAVVYGADHAQDLAARAQRIGFGEPDTRWLGALEVGHGELGLGRVQVEQLLGGP